MTAIHPGAPHGMLAGWFGGAGNAAAGVPHGSARDAPDRTPPRGLPVRYLFTGPFGTLSMGASP
jgi:hypothetical protein